MYGVEGGGGGAAFPSLMASRLSAVSVAGGALGALGLCEELALDEATAAPGVGVTGVAAGGRVNILFLEIWGCTTPGVGWAG